jgi:hypothetical protein
MTFVLQNLGRGQPMLQLKSSARRAALMSCTFLMCAIPMASLAQATPPTNVAGTVLPELTDGKRIFLPAYFTADSPQTAQDMVDRIPGFDIDDGDSVRGFGGAAGNVLIDGARPTSKSEGLGSILSRIPAANVERIELLEGAAAGALAPGKTLVVNVIRKANSKSGGTWEAKVDGVSSGFILPSLEASYTARLGRWNITAGLETEYDDVENFIGYEGFQTPQGIFTERGPNDDRRRARYGKVSLGADATLGAYKLKVNGNWFQGAFRRNWVHVATRTGASSPYRIDQGRETNDEINWEIGGDVERALWGWTGKVALLWKKGDQDNGSFAGFNEIGAPQNFGRFLSSSLTEEQVGRATFKRKFGAHQIEFGGETAFNSLDFDGAYAEGDGTIYVIQPGDISATQVQETRQEAFVSDSWTISPKLTLEATMTGEWSTISQSGDAAKERSFFYPKPRLKLDWKPVTGWTYRVEVEREVGQLDFGAFADSASVGDGSQNSGNLELRPEQGWLYSASIERRWGKRGVLNARLLYAQTEDKLTLVPLANGGVALGNVDEAKRYGYNVSWTLPLDFILSGLEVEGNYRWRDSEFNDPLTGRPSPYSGDTGRQFNGNIRYDMPARKLRVGAWMYRGNHRYDFRPDQRYEWPSVTFLGAWVETKAIKGLTIELGVEDLFGSTFSRTRTDFSPDRRTGSVSRIQYRERSKDGTWYLFAKGKF